MAFFKKYARSAQAWDNRNTKVKIADLGDGEQPGYISLDTTHKSTSEALTHADLDISKREGDDIHPNVGIISPSTGLQIPGSEPLERHVRTKKS
jgi:hypothetical protein